MPTVITRLTTSLRRFLRARKIVSRPDEARRSPESGFLLPVQSKLKRKRVLLSRGGARAEMSFRVIARDFLRSISRVSLVIRPRGIRIASIPQPPPLLFTRFISRSLITSVRRDYRAEALRINWIIDRLSSPSLPLSQLLLRSYTETKIASREQSPSLHRRSTLNPRILLSCRLFPGAWEARGGRRG